MLPRGRIATDLAVGIIGAADIDRSAGDPDRKVGDVDLTGGSPRTAART